MKPTKTSEQDFESLLAADQRKERRLLWGELAVLGVLVVVAVIRIWVVRN